MPSDGTNKGKHRTPKSVIAMKVIVRVIHGLTILATEADGKIWQLVE